MPSPADDLRALLAHADRTATPAVWGRAAHVWLDENGAAVLALLDAAQALVTTWEERGIVPDRALAVAVRRLSHEAL